MESATDSQQSLDATGELFAEIKSIANDEQPGLECPECTAEQGHSVIIYTVGKEPPKMRLGLHRKQAHGVSGEGRHKVKPRQNTPTKRARKNAGPRLDTSDTEPVRNVSLITDAASAASKRKGTPSADDLTKVFTRVYEYATTYAATIVVESDPRDLNDDDRNRIATDLAGSPADGAAVLTPMARLLAKTSLNKQYGRDLIDNSDVLDAIFCAVAISARWRAYFRERSTAQPAAFAATLITSANHGVANGAQRIPHVPEGTILTPDLINGVTHTPGPEMMVNPNAFDN